MGIGSGALGGAASGASLGSLGGPIGMGIGAAVGGIGSLLGGIFGKGNKTPKAAYTQPSQDVMFGEIMSQLANWGSPVGKALYENSPGFTKLINKSFKGAAPGIFQPSPDMGGGGGAMMNPRFGYGGGNFGGYNRGYGGPIQMGRYLQDMGGQMSGQAMTGGEMERMNRMF